MLKYLEIDSTYRNRNQFPNPCQFNVINSQKGISSTLSRSMDPISLAMPIVSYVPNNISLPGEMEYSNTNLSNNITVQFNNSLDVNRTSNYYRGLQCKLVGQLDSSTTVTIGPVIINSWDYLNTINSIDTFRVSFNQTLDTNYYPITYEFFITSSTNFDLGLLFIPNGTQDNQTYKGYYAYNETQNQYSPILSYVGFYSLASIEPVPGWNNSDTISIREELPLTYGNFSSNSSSTYVYLSSASDARAGFYSGKILRITQTGSPFQNKTYNINWYSGAPGYVAKINYYVGEAIHEGDTYEILDFTRDNFVPLLYTGRRTEQEICYEIQNIALILPNIGVEQGGVMQSYPYFYVEFNNISTSNSGNVNIIYSNNPNSTRKLLRVPVTDINPSSLCAFLKLDKTYMSQNIKLSPSSSFKFGVYLPDGRPLILSIPDTKSPLPPNPYLQISILFSLKRIF